MIPDSEDQHGAEELVLDNKDQPDTFAPATTLEARQNDAAAGERLSTQLAGLGAENEEADTAEMAAFDSIGDVLSYPDLMCTTADYVSRFSKINLVQSYSPYARASLSSQFLTGYSKDTPIFKQWLCIDAESGCPYTTDENCNLPKHQQVCRFTDAVTEPKRFSCTIDGCDMTSETQGHLNRHTRTVHTE